MKEKYNPSLMNPLTRAHERGLEPQGKPCSIILPQQCGSKNPPFSTSMHTDAKLWHVYVGEDALKRAAEAYELLLPNYPVAVMALPIGKSPFDYHWPVNGRTLDILSKGECNDDVFQVGQALYTCGAKQVYGVVNDNLAIWERIAA